MVVTVAEASTDVPAVLVVSASELGARSGSLLREVAGGALVRVDDLRVRRVCALVVPPQLADAVLEFLGVSLDGMPEPGFAADRLPPDEAAS